MDRVVIEQVVVTRQHAGVFVSHPHVDPRLADLFDRSDVVPVAVGLEYRGHAQSTRHAQQPVVFIGRVDERRLTGSLAAHDVHVVFDWSHDESVHFGAAVRPDQFDVVHVPQCHSAAPCHG